MRYRNENVYYAHLAPMVNCFVYVHNYILRPHVANFHPISCCPPPPLPPTHILHVANILYNRCTCMQPTYTIFYQFFLVACKPMIKVLITSALLLAILWSCSAEQQTPTYPLGDVRNCPTSQPGNSNLQLNRMTVLPGIGFDNLRNIDMGQVFLYNYSTCTVSNDEKYLLPDSVRFFRAK